MIGFQRGLMTQDRTSDEGPDTSSLKKQELYDSVADKWFIPPSDSKGVTRDYLLQVRRDQVYRVSTLQIKQFEVELTAEMQRRASNINNSVLIKKLNYLLSSTGRKELGFTEFDVPDQAWLYRIARYIDASSITEFFECPAKPEPALSNSSSMLSKIYHGRMNASIWLFRNNPVKQNRKLWDALKLISETYRASINNQMSLYILEQEITQIREKQVGLQTSLDDMVSKASLTYTAIEEPSLRPENVLAGGDSVSPALRELLIRNARM
jgi:hypothetical protein